MFKRFAKPAPAKAAPTHVVRDRWTRQILLTGTKADCDAYRVAFGGCFVEAA